MRKLLFVLILVAILSQTPQISAQFKEEKEGMDAAFNKAVKAYDAVANTYDSARSDIEAIQGKLIEIKEGADQGINYGKRINDEVGEHTGGLSAIAEGVKKFVGTQNASESAAIVGGTDTEGGSISKK